MDSGVLTGESPRSDRLLFSMFLGLKFLFSHQEFDATELISVRELTADKRPTAKGYALCNAVHKHQFPILKHGERLEWYSRQSSRYAFILRRW